MAEGPFSRKSHREPQTKAFAIASSALRGNTAVTRYESIPEYATANTIAQTCMTYAQAYSETMLARLLQEEPDYFEDKGISKSEFSIHLQHNICLGVLKYKNAVFADATAQLAEKDHLTDRVRRLANGGDKFHPYL